MRAFFGTRISEHLSKTPEGFLICRGVPICRTGFQPYKGSEIGLNTDEIVDVYRSPSEVLSAKTIASAEGKVVTDEHPGSFVNPFNASAYSKGHIQNVRRGRQLPSGETPLVADLVIIDGGLIDKVQRGAVRDISCGYDCEYRRNSDGQFEQRRIRINHVAIVPTGRAGSSVRILDEGKMAKQSRDQASEWKEMRKEIERLTELVNKLVAKREEPDENEDSELITETGGVDPEIEANDRLLEVVRSLRPAIVRGGNPKAIDAYNNAIRVLKGYNKALKQYPPSGDPVLAAMDAELRRRLRAEVSPDTSFAEQARLYHRRSAQEGKKASVDATAARDQNRTTDTQEDWASSMNAAGRKMREKETN